MKSPVTITVSQSGGNGRVRTLNGAGGGRYTLVMEIALVSMVCHFDTHSDEGVDSLVTVAGEPCLTKVAMP